MKILDINKAPTRREALELIFANWQPAPEVETVKVSDAIGRVTAADAFAKYNLPVVRASSMDGIGVISERFKDGVPDASGWTLGEDYVRADTGDDFDDRFDAVVAIEDATLLERGGVRFAESVTVTPGLNIRPSGSSVKRGELLVKAKTRLRPFDLSVLVLGGQTEVAVFKSPIVAFIPTGSELIPAGSVPKRGENIASNSIMVEHMLREFGASPRMFPIANDDKAALKTALTSAVELADIILICGGSSKGSEDFNAEIISEMGEYLLHWIASAPGKPMCAAMANGKPIINIPGPPLATYFVVDWCVSALVARYFDVTPPIRTTVKARLTNALDATPGMEILRKVQLTATADGYDATIMGNKGPSLGKLTADAQIVTDGGETSFEPGSLIDVEVLR